MRTVGAGRWLLLLALAAGLVGMHHLAAGPPDGPAMTAAPMVSMADFGTGHPAPVPAGSGAVPVAAGWAPSMDMAMHLCLAVLVALGLLVLLVLAVGVPVRRPPTASVCAVVPATARPPPRSAVRLALLCVLRN